MWKNLIEDLNDFFYNDYPEKYKKYDEDLENLEVHLIDEVCVKIKDGFKADFKIILDKYNNLIRIKEYDLMRMRGDKIIYAWFCLERC